MGIEVPKQRKTGHGRSVPVAMGVIAGDSDDGVVIVRCERITKEQMRSEHSRVEMTYCRSVVHCRGDSIDEISEVVGLFGGAEVFDSFDEFGLADLSNGNRRERQDLELRPTCLNPDDHSITELERTFQNSQLVGRSEAVNRVEMCAACVEPELPPMPPMPGRIIIGCPQVGKDSVADTRDVGDEVAILGVPSSAALLKIVLEYLKEPLPVSVRDPYGCALRMVSGGFTDRKQNPLWPGDLVSGVGVERLKLQRIRRALAFKNDDSSGRAEFLIAGKIGDTFILSLGKGFLSFYLDALPVPLSVYCAPLESTAPRPVEVSSLRVTVDVNMIEIASLLSQGLPFDETSRP